MRGGPGEPSPDADGGDGNEKYGNGGDSFFGGGGRGGENVLQAGQANSGGGGSGDAVGGSGFVTVTEHYS